MELKVSAENPGFSSSESTSDPEDHKISEGEDEDDDRNHKHRRREAHSQSLEGNSLGHDFAMRYRKRNKTFQNGHSYRDGEPQSSKAWKSYGFAPDRGFGARFEKKPSNQGSFSDTSSDTGQWFRANQPLRSEIGRGREPFLLGSHDPRLGIVDASAHIVQPRLVSSAVFGGRAMVSVSAQGPSWTSFGLIPGVPRGGLDSMHPLGLQGALEPAINPQISLGIARQRCRDFEERGFCLRGDMCTMEHGVNRIVIDDFQSLSQFNLPVSVPGAQLLGTSSVQGTSLTSGSTPGTLVNNIAFHLKGGKPGVTDDGALGGSLPVSSDVYDPDQPLLTNGNPKTSSALLALNQQNVDGADAFTDADLSSQQNIDSSFKEFNSELALRNSTAAGSQNASMWGTKRSSHRNLVENGKNYSVGTSPGYLKQDGKSEEVLNTSFPDNAHQGMQINVNANCLINKESSIKLHRKPSQKALSTLFVNGIPLKYNKKECLLSHFRKFGEVIDIYIPMNSGRAFVQFSRKEEAELALKSPDAVMGNRFIKLWWANRDNISDDGKQSPSSLSIPHGIIFNPSTSKFLASEKVKEYPHVPPAYDCRKALVVSSKTPVQQKKLENLEQLKEELRKKQQMLDQKRNEFKLQLDKLEKQTFGPKDTTPDRSNKSLQVEVFGHPRKAETSESLATENMASDRTASSEQPVPSTPATAPPVPEHSIPFTVKRFKLDNRPTSFKIVPPLPADLAKIDALEEHFNTFGGLSLVELEEPKLEETNDVSISSSVAARISFSTRNFAEKAFSQGRLWRSHKLQFVWLTSVKSIIEGRGNSLCDTEASCGGEDPKIEAGDPGLATKDSDECFTEGENGS